MKLRHYTIIATLALLAASCAHEESEVAQISDIQLAITAAFATPAADFAAAGVGVRDASSVENPAKSATKSTATAFESGDLLGLYAVKSGGELNAASNIINNHQLKVAESGAIVGDQLPAYYPDKSSSLDLFSYYPYQSGNATADALGVLVGIRTHQTDFSHVQASDLCYGRKLDAAPSAAPHPLQFSHSFAQLRLNFSLYEGCSAISAVKLLAIKDSAKLNLQTGLVTLLPHTADVSPYVGYLSNSADATNPLQFTAIIPAQSLSGPCVEITLKDGTIYYYHAVSPIALKESATNTLNLRIADKKAITASGTPAITAWGVEPSNAVLGDAVNNVITLHWLAPHASYASIDKITLSMVDIFNRRREVDVTPIIDPLSSAEYATYTFPLILGADSGYPQIIEGIKLYAGATLIRNSPRAAILGSILSRAGAHTLGLRLCIELSETTWNNVSGYGDTKAITVTTTGTQEWTATSSNANLTIAPTSGISGQTATLTWALHSGDPAPATRSATVTFATNPAGATATLTTTQNGAINHIIINGLKWATGNLVADGANGAKIGAPIDGGLYFQFGSLLGWKGGASGDGTGVCTKANGSFYVGSSFNATDEIAVVPTVASATIAAISGTWPNQSQNLYYFGNTSYATAYASLRNFAGFANGSLADKGVGDPCTYYLSGTWRLPTTEEWKALCNNAAHNSTPATANAAWTTSPAAGMNFNNNSTKLFIAASGYRDSSDGTIYNVGIGGNYWSESVCDAVYGHYLTFYSHSVAPQNGSYRRHGLSARCVQDAPTKPQPPTADQIVTINGLKWTTGNLVANGPANAKVGAPTDYGLYFQFGSLLGWKGGASGDGTGICNKANRTYFTSPFNATSEIHVKPSGFTTIGNIGTTWPNQMQNLYYFGLSSYATNYAKLRDFAGFAAGTLAPSGVGDPCRYYLGGTWRLPTAEEFKALCNNAANNSTPATANAAWTTSPTAGMNFNNNGTKYFIPASGSRSSSDGAVYDVGTYGRYWSESVSDGANGYYLYFDSGYVYPQVAYYRRSGFPVRCVSN